MTREEIAKELGWAYINVESDLLDRIVRVVRLAEDAERQAIIQIITPSEEHRRDASWGYLGGGEGVELLDNLVERIARRDTAILSKVESYQDILFSIEELYMSCWGICDDLKLYSQDDYYIKSLAEVYNFKFKKLWEVIEKLYRK